MQDAGEVFIPVNSRFCNNLKIETPKKVLKRRFLSSIKSKITKTDDTELGILVRASCMEALEPTKVIPV